MFPLRLAKLTHRKILKISGPDCYPYLQGLLSNDLRYLYEPDRIPVRKHARNSSSVISSFMLNAHGRAICDMMLYRTPLTRFECNFTQPGQATEHDELLIECDSQLSNGLANTLYAYRVRRKVKLSEENDVAIWCLFPEISSDIEASDERAIAALKQYEKIDLINEQMTLVSDPRLSQLGMRIITKEGNIHSLKKSLESIVNQSIHEATSKDYTLLRYRLGVGEGVSDHPESDCFPLESNADFLGSVSFNKGCYLGQELTARIHYQGVVRKRLMPIVLEEEFGLGQKNDNQEILPPLSGTDIVDAGNKNKKVGILRSLRRNRGLALLRHEIALNATNLIHEGSKIKISTYKPYWWNSISH